LEISVRTARKWWARYRTEGSVGLLDRSSRPHDSPARTAAPLQLAVKVLRWQHWTGAQIASALGISAATARRILRRSGLNRRGRLEAALGGWERVYNEVRFSMALDGRTPAEKLAAVLAAA
jgi:hypothetical protein